MFQFHLQLDPVGSTVRYEVMKLCTGQQCLVLGGTEAVIDVTGSGEGIFAFIY